jgi:Ca-activated chloride channel family protein
MHADTADPCLLVTPAAEASVLKIDVAKEVLNGILDLLNPNDTVSIVLFSTGACVPTPLQPVSCLDIPRLQSQVS